MGSKIIEAKNEYTAYQIEQILLAQPLVFGSQAALAVLPNLTADKFVYGSSGSLGGNEHRIIWKAIENCVLVDRAEPFMGNLSGISHLKDYLDTLCGLLTGFYGIQSFDFYGYRKRAVQVHRTGRAYRMATLGANLGKIVEDQTKFEKYVEKIGDIDSWTAEVIRNFTNTGEEHSGEGYLSVEDVAESVVEDWDRQVAGEQLVLLPMGVPLLYGAGLFPAPSFAVIHGLSSGGKSTLVHNVINLGTALGLVQAGLRGCVAINSLEMTEKQCIARMAGTLAGFDLMDLIRDPSNIKSEDFARLKAYARFVGKLPIVIDPDNNISPAIMQYRMNSVHLGAKGPIRQLSSDYLELFKMPEGLSDEGREAILGEIARIHFQISRDFDCSAIAVSQSTYDSSSKTWIAGLYGQRGSRAITHKADIVAEAVNYAALKRAGTPYKVAAGLDDEHFWLLLQKYRGGPTDRRMAFEWVPEHTRLIDPGLKDQYTFGGVDSPLFEHLLQVEKMLAQHPTTRIIPIEDTPLAEYAKPNGHRQLAPIFDLDDDEGEDF